MIRDILLTGWAVVAVSGWALIALSSCTTAEEQLADDQAWCIRYGFQPGSQGFASCVMSEQQTKYLAHAAIQAGIISSIK